MTRRHPLTAEDPGSTPWPLRADRPDVGRFGWTRHAAGGVPKFHRGVDFVCAVGAPVFAAHDGRVVRDGEEEGGGGYGQRIYLQAATGLTTVYAHLSVEFLRVGDAIRAGHCLGLAGRSGNLAHEPTHLHFEVRADLDAASAINPEHWLHGLGNVEGVHRA